MNFCYVNFSFLLLSVFPDKACGHNASLCFGIIFSLVQNDCEWWNPQVILEYPASEISEELYGDCYPLECLFSAFPI